jgi:hypothetical protein
MHIEDLANEYLAKTGEELLQLAEDSEQLTFAAQTALTNELAKRRIYPVERSKVFRGETSQPRPGPAGDSAAPPPPDSHRVGQFIAEVLRVYHSHFWLFVNLTAPAVIIGYLAILTGRHEVREIARHISSFEVREYRMAILELFFVNQLEYFVVWISLCLSFGAICSALQQIEKGTIQSFHDSFAAVRRRMGPFLRLSLLLYFLLCLAMVAASLLEQGIFWITRRSHAHVGHFTFIFLTFLTAGLVLLVFSRFALAMPAVILDDYGVSQAVFRSDELTEKKWLTLAVLLAKSLVGGYVAGMLPFWIAARIPTKIPAPWFPWLFSITSVAAVIVVEPMMFIGFALLYIRTSSLVTTFGNRSTLR